MCGAQGFMGGKVAKRWALNRKLRTDPPHVWVSNVSSYAWVPVGGGILRCALCMFRFPMPWRWHCAWDSASSFEGRLLCVASQESRYQLNEFKVVMCVLPCACFGFLRIVRGTKQAPKREKTPVRRMCCLPAGGHPSCGGTQAHRQVKNGLFFS